MIFLTHSIFFPLFWHPFISASPIYLQIPKSKIHGKLADAHGMCEECFLSFAAKKETNQETSKLFVGKLGLDGVQSPLFKDFVPGSLGRKSCTCCSKPWRCRPNVQKLFPSRPVATKVSKPDIPLPSPPRARCLNCRDGFKKNRDKFSVSSTPLLLGISDDDSLSHVGYTEVKITSDSDIFTSDSDSDFPLSDDDDARDRSDLLDELGKCQDSRFISKKQFDDMFPMKKTDRVLNSGSDLDTVTDSSEKSGKNPSDPQVDVGYGVGDTSWQSFPDKSDSPLLPELITLDDIPLTSNAVEVDSVVLADNSGNNFSFSNQFSTYDLSELIFQNDVQPSQKLRVLPSKLTAQNAADAMENDDIGHKSVMRMWEDFDIASTTIATEGAVHVSKRVIFQNANVGVDSIKSIDVSKLPSEQMGRLDHDGIDDKVKSDTSLPSTSLSTSLPSALLGPIPPLSNSHSTMNGQVDESHLNEASISNGFHKRQSSLSMERCNSFESLDGSFVSDIDGETLIERLRRQVDYDRKWINNLYKELEEERNASAIAANEAMAMITKLQEEKAALHMDALQYLRMMEEQAEYDVDALQKANDLLAKKEKEIQDLDAELEFYQLRYPEDKELELEQAVNQAWNLVGDDDKLDVTGMSDIGSVDISGHELMLELSCNDPAHEELGLGPAR
ncbi:putative myosin-binding protein 4 [Drosera capensis]